MKKIITLLFATLFATAIYAAEITYRVASYNADTDDFVLEAWGEKPAGASAYFFNDYGATTGNRYNQIPRRRQASFELYGWQGCAIKSITFSMCSNNKAGTIGYTIGMAIPKSAKWLRWISQANNGLANGCRKTRMCMATSPNRSTSTLSPPTRWQST
ncbi:MAG: hypothetical protein SPG67_05410 [Sodaliphilus sp.]|nr:hypothetical protein [Sodaliphilus sp.]